jgi:quercetin dioxygenase-like cupin family protein
MNKGQTVPVRWGDGEAILGTPFRIAIPAEATGGHAVCITIDMPPGVIVDEHTHPDEDQICIVLGGQLGCRVGGAESILCAGDLQVLPRAVPHALWNAGDEFVRLVEFYTPPGMEQRFIRAGAQALAEGASGADHNHYDAAQGGSTS